MVDTRKLGELQAVLVKKIMPSSLDRTQIASVLVQQDSKGRRALPAAKKASISSIPAAYLLAMAVPCYTRASSSSDDGLGFGV